jgi:long-chain acyl-CoA synthetase
LSAAHLGSEQFSKVRVAWGTGGTVTDGDIDAMHRLFPNAKWRFSWGATEICAPTSALVSYDDLKKHPQLGMSVGKVNAFCEIKLIDDNNQPVDAGEVGEAWIRSSMVFLGYFQALDTPGDIFTEDGFFKTGDLLRVDEQGFYYFAGRKKDMVKTGGENVFAQEVEKVVREYPGINDCAMIGIPDPSFGEAVAVVVELECGRSLDIDDFKEHNKRNLASFKKPRYLYYIDELPKNSIGKLQKRELHTINPEDFIKLY